MTRLLLRTAAIAVLLTAGVAAQPNVEEQARRQLESGREFFRTGRYGEALKDFQTVAEGYPTSRVADDALLAIAEYQLEIAHDAAAARETAENLFRRYAAGDSAPMGYVLAGRATIELDPSAAGLDSALASFDRVPRLFPGSDAVAPALYYGAHVLRRAERPDEALDRLREIALQFPRSTWAARASLLEGRLLVGAGEPVEALNAFQRVVRQFPDSAEAQTAIERNTILYRLHLLPRGDALFTDTGRAITGRSDRLRDIDTIALLPDGQMAVAGRPGVLVLDGTGGPVRQAPASEPRQLWADARGRLLIVQKSLVSRETDTGLKRLALTAVQSGQPKLLQDLSAGAELPNGDLLVADRDLRAVARFGPDGRFAGMFAQGRFRTITIGPSDHVALLHDDRDVTIADRNGTVLARIPAQGAGYDLGAAEDLDFDVLGHLYVLVRDGIAVFGPDGRLIRAFSSGPQGFRNARALAVDLAGRLYVYDDDQERVVVYR